MPVSTRTIGRATTPLVLALMLTADAPAPRSARQDAATDAVARVAINDNRRPAGTMRGGRLRLALVASLGEWRPDGDSAPGAIVPAFGEDGHAPSIPGPLVRVYGGTEVEVTVRNTLHDATLTVHGLGDRTSAASGHDSLVLAPGERRTVHMRLDAPGTYYYWGTTMGRAVDWRTREDAQLSGAIVVDRPDEPRPTDRVMVIGMWADTVGRVLKSRSRLLAVVNGRSWPHTERLEYAVGDSVRWRIINASADSHPMHLHGFYFRVDSHGDGDGDTVYAASDRPLSVTDLVVPGATMTMAWVPVREGNWLFHCHLPDHFAPRGSLGGPRTVADAPAAGSGAPMNHALDGMNGLVMGVRVHPSMMHTASRTVAAPVIARRRLRLTVHATDSASVASPGYTYALEDSAGASPSPASVEAAPTIVLRRGEPVAITVVNHLAAPTSVHWHGIELESYYDGVAGFSGSASRMSPAIAPSDSFVAQFTPPRAGTFIYHTHVDEQRQQPAGLAGALVVIEPSAAFDAATDRVLLLTSPRDSALELRRVLVNGRLDPTALELVVGVAYRLRFINMTMRRPNGRVELRAGGALSQWRDLARDGAALPVSRQVMRPAKEVVSIGQTVDVELRPETAGPLTLEVRAGPFDQPGIVIATIPVRVRAGP